MCKQSPSHRFTFQLCLWDFFKTIEQVPEPTIVNVALFCAALISSFSLSLGVFKVVDFHDLQPNMTKFVRLVLRVIFKSHEDEGVMSIFGRLSSAKSEHASGLSQVGVGC